MGLPGLVLAFPLTAISKIIFDAVDGLKAYGYLLGEAKISHPTPPYKPSLVATDLNEDQPNN